MSFRCRFQSVFVHQPQILSAVQVSAVVCLAILLGIPRNLVTGKA